MKFFYVLVLSSYACMSVHAAQKVLDDKKITFVVVNGGADSPNQGTTCIRIDNGISEQCTSGFVAIRNNNKELISAALHAKATERPIWFFYEDASGSNHCPGAVFTPCVVTSIGLK
ncbi:MAG TPA: hypothetical protein VIZ65_08690 [Cellvibrionaceae bacterium]